MLACAVACGARADLSVFDPPGQVLGPAPIGLAVLAAWDDAALRCTPEQWGRVAALHRDHLAEWYRAPDALTAGNAAADARFARDLQALLADDPRQLEASRAAVALDRVVRAVASSLGAGASVRRAVLLAARQACDDPAPGAADRLAPIRIALERAARFLESGTRTTANDPLPLLAAMQSVRPALEAALGADATDQLVATITSTQDRMHEAWRQPLFESILRHATRLAAEERTAALAALSAAGRERRDALAGRTPVAGSWSDACAATAERLRARLAAVIGGARAASLFDLATPWSEVPGRPGESPNAARDRLLDALADAEGVAAIARECGDGAWHVEHALTATDQADSMHLAPAWTREEVLACLRAAPSADDDIVIDALLRDHAARVAALRTKARSSGWIRDYADAMHAEDEVMMAAVRAAFGEARIDAEALSLLRLSRIERGLPIDVQGTMVPGVGWVDPPMPVGSIAATALGLPQVFVSPVPAAACLELRRALAPQADAFADAWLGAWRKPVPAKPPAPGEPIAPPPLRGRAFAQAQMERVLRLVDALETRATEGAPAADTAAMALLATTYQPIARNPRVLRTLQAIVPGVAPELRDRVDAALFRADGRPHDVVAGRLEALRLCAAAERDESLRPRAARVHLDDLRADWLGSAQGQARLVEALRILRAAGVPAARDLLEP